MYYIHPELLEFEHSVCFLSHVLPYFIGKESVTNMHDLSVYVKKELPFVLDLSV